MRLKRLVLQGFKSFKDRTVVHFDDGITGIVGPNGCGKSNIVDALFWVMGEMSAKHLRGKSMKDVIFAGSSKYNPGSFAEVSLILENDEGKSIHIGDKVSAPSEIQLTRKLYRSGDTEYRINGTPARLRDIQEVFMDTGAGAKSYSIIAQGEINRLVQAKPEERRQMIEEVAGITKFKMRKKESLRKIEATDSNLNRLKDLQTEVHKNLKSLERQAEKAERAKNLKERIRKTDLSVNAHKELEFLKDLKDNSKFLIEREREITEWSERKSSIEEGLIEEREKRKELNSQIEQCSKIFHEESKELAGFESTLKFNKKSLKEKERLLEVREDESHKLIEEIEDRRTRLMDLQEDLKELEKKHKDEFDLTDLEGKVDHLKERMEMKEGTLSEIRTELDEEKKTHFSQEQELYKKSSRVNELSTALEDISKEMEQLEEQFSSVSGEISGEREAVLRVKEDLETTEKELAEKTDNLIKEEKALKDIEGKYKEVSKSQIEKQSRFDSLKQIQESFADQDDAGRAYLENHPQNANTLGNLIECDQEYELAVSRVLKDLDQYLVLKNGSVINDSWIKEQDVAVNFLLNKEASIQTPANSINLKDIVSIKDSDYSEIANILEGFVIVDSLETASIKEFEDSGISAVVSKDGKMIFYFDKHFKKISFVKESESGTSAIARNNEMKRLDEKIKSISNEKEQLKDSIEQKEQFVSELREQKEGLRNQITELKTAYAGQKSALDSKIKNFEQSTTRIQVLKERKTKLSSEKFELLEGEEKLQKAAEELKQTIADKEEVIEDFSAEVKELRISYTEEKEKLLEIQMEIKTFDDKKKNLESQISDIEKTVERATEKLETNTGLNEEAREELLALKEEIDTLVNDTEQMTTELKQKEKDLKALKSDFNALNQMMQRRENEVKDLTSKVSRAEKDMITKQARVDQIIEDEEHLVRDVFERYRIDLRENLRLFLEYSEEDISQLRDVNSMFIMEGTNEETGESEQVEIEKETYEFSRKYGQELKDLKYKLKNYKQSLQRLGEINWQAVEDYDKQKLRFQFLKEQEEELNASLVHLQEAIERIDVKSKERFKEAFNEVNFRFEKVFPIIFGGGNAKLQVVGSLDSAECGVDIIAQPPGKKMQNINLMSGGEKAMTAVSLIFSIFLVKPSPFCLLDEVDAPLDDANVGRFNDLLREMSSDSQFILITHNKKTMELNDTLYGVTMQEPGISSAVSVQLQ